METGNLEKKESEIVFSRSVKAGKRIYYVDVKKARNDDLYVCITESKRYSNEGEEPTFEKHKIFLYKEDFTSFLGNLEEAVGFVRNHFGTIEDREEWSSNKSAEEQEEQQSAEEQAPTKTNIFKSLFSKN